MISLLTILAAIWGALLTDSGQPARTAGDSPTDLNQTLIRMESGTLVFSYPTREGVRGNSQDLEIALSQYNSRVYFNGCRDEDGHMVAGPATAVITVRHGLIKDLDITVGRSRKAPDKSLDLGTIDPATAAAFFLQQAQDLDNDTAEDALMAAVIARVEDIAAPLLEILDDRSNGSELRQDTLMWLAVLAGEKALEPLGKVIEEEDEELEMREHAVFALGQLDHTDTMPMLLKIARNQDEPYLQQAAFFVLSEHDTPEVRRLFEEILLAN